jgi:hypothetical protein
MRRGMVSIDFTKIGEQFSNRFTVSRVEPRNDFIPGPLPITQLQLARSAIEQMSTAHVDDKITV